MRITRLKQCLLGGVATLLLSTSLLTGVSSAVTVGGPSDCDNNAVVRCGVHSTQAVINSYQSSKYVRTVYRSMGISATEIANLKTTDHVGRVTRSGDVYIDSQSGAVAHNAMSVGRQNMPGSTAVTQNGATFYKRPPSVSFQQSSLPAIVSMSNGKFQFAIIASCGNAVTATAVVQKPAAKPKPAPAPAPKPAVTPAPTPAPAPVQVQTQAQSQSVNVTNTVTTPPAPAAPAAPATQPAAATQALPNTGPTDVLGIFAATVAAGYLAYRRFIVRRFAS